MSNKMAWYEYQGGRETQGGVIWTDAPADHKPCLYCDSRTAPAQQNLHGTVACNRHFTDAPLVMTPAQVEETYIGF
jgi:hypothetical protein